VKVPVISFPRIEGKGAFPRCTDDSNPFVRT